MSDSFYQKLSNIMGLFVLVAIFCLLVMMANLELKDFDIWLHMGVGQHIVENGFQIPDKDVLSSTVAGKPWVNHEWLFQVIVYKLYNLWGEEGLINMQVVIVTFTLLILLFLGYNKEKQLSSVFILLLLSLVYHSRFTTRPDLFSLLFFSLYIFLLAFFLHKRWSIYAFFILQVIWTNMHGFFFFGPLFVLIGIFAEFLKRRVRLPYEWNKVGRLTNDEYKRLKLIFFVVILACFFNPLFLKGAWYPIKVFFSLTGESKIFFKKIVELQPPITPATIFSADRYVYYKLLIIMSFVSFFFNRRKLDIGILIFWLIFLFFSLRAVRNLVFFAFAAYLAFVTNALSISLKDIVPLRLKDKKFGYLLSITLKIFLVIWILQFIVNVSTNGYFDFDKYERKSEFGGISQRQYPTKAVDFLVDNNVKGSIYNDFNSGAYLVGRCFPNIKVFIDGRTEVYGPEFFKNYMSIWEGDNLKGFKKALDQYDLTIVFLNTLRHAAPKETLKFLYKSEDWILVYFGYDGLIFLKNIKKNEELIEKYKIDLREWKPEKLDLYRLGLRKVVPYHFMNRASNLEILNLDDQAILELEEAIHISPYFKEPYGLLGKIYAKRKEYEKAFIYLRIAAMMSPGNVKLRENYALICFDLKEYEYAAKEYARIVQAWPNRPKAYFFLAKTYVMLDKGSEAYAVLEDTRKLFPKALKDVLEIGTLLMEREDYANAEKVYVLYLKTADKHLERAHLQLGELYKKMGDLKKAKEEFKTGLSLDPENEKLKERLRGLGGNFSH